MLRLSVIAIIWLGCTVAWVILGSTLAFRSGEASGALDHEVHALWGPPGRQVPPTGAYSTVETTKETVTTNAPAGAGGVTQVVEREQQVQHALELKASRIAVDLDLEHRKKGLLWYPTYAVDFVGTYTFSNPAEAEQDATLRFALQREEGRDAEGRSIVAASSVSFDGFEVLDGHGRPVDYRIEGGQALWQARFGPGKDRRFTVRYRTRGTSSWEYAMTEGTGRVADFELVLRTDFENVDFPSGATSPTEHAVDGSGWRGVWRYKSLISAAPVGVVMPTLLNPGPLASKVTFFAPVSLLFFFFVVAILAAVQRRELHPMHYLLLGCAFFAFHLLFSYLVDHLSIAVSFALSSLVSVFLVTSYARLFVGWKFALREVGLAQVLYLVLFSYTFFWEGFTGLTITVGAIVTLFVVMQITGRASWSELLQRRTAAAVEA